MTEMKAGDTFTMDLPDSRRLVRLWCWLTRKPLPLVRRAFRVTGPVVGGEVAPAICIPEEGQDV